MSGGWASALAEARRRRRDREQIIADDAANEERGHQQRRRDRTADEGFRDVHRGFSSPAPDGAVLTPVLPTPCGPISGSFAVMSPGLPSCTATLTPGERSVCPEVTTFSPAAMPLPMSAFPASTWVTITGRASTVASGLIA